MARPGGNHDPMAHMLHNLDHPTEGRRRCTVTAKHLSVVVILALLILVCTPVFGQTELAMRGNDEIAGLLGVPARAISLSSGPATRPAGVQIGFDPAIRIPEKHALLIGLPAGRETAALDALDSRLNYPVTVSRGLTEVLLDPLPPSFRVLFGLFMPGAR